MHILNDLTFFSTMIPKQFLWSHFSLFYDNFSWGSILSNFVEILAIYVINDIIKWPKMAKLVTFFANHIFSRIYILCENVAPLG